MIDGLKALSIHLSQDDIKSREEWHAWKRENSDRLIQYLDYRHKDGMPDVTQVIAPHFHEVLPLIGFNYTVAAGVALHHYEDGWSPTLRLARGIVFERATGNLVARPFPKFFNFGEIGGAWGEGEPEVTVKEDGHLLIAFRYGKQVLCKTRGEFHSPTARLGEQAVLPDLTPHWLGLDLKDITVLCELIHPDTKVGVDYGNRRALILIGMFDNATGLDLPYDELVKAADALGVEVVKKVAMTRAELVAVINGGGNNAEGFVARFEDGHRVKFKYGQYMAEMREKKAQDRKQPPQRLAGVGRPAADRALQRGASYVRSPTRRP